MALKINHSLTKNKLIKVKCQMDFTIFLLAISHQKNRAGGYSMKNTPCPVKVSGSEGCSDYGIAGGQSFIQSRKSARHAFTAGPAL